MEELRSKLIKNKKELEKSVKENSVFNTGKLLNIVADLIEYALNFNISSELEDLQCKNEINKSLQSKKTYSVDEAFKNELDIIDYNSKFVKMGVDSIDDFLNKLGNEVFIIDKKHAKEKFTIDEDQEFDQEKKESQLKIPEELKRYIHKTNKDNIDLISMSIEKILKLNLKVDIESFCIQIIRTLNKEQKIVFNHIIEENKRNDLTKEAILNYIKFIDDIKTYCITNILGIDQFSKNSEFCRGQLFAFKNILGMIKKQESEAKDGSKSK